MSNPDEQHPWRSLAEWRDPARVAEEGRPEFAPGADEPPADDTVDADGVARRTFLKMVGASMALAAGCSRPPSHKLLPYTDEPTEGVEGRPLHYATTLAVGGDGYGVGVLVEANEHRPTKVEGNPDHPDSLGATHALEQASVLSLYDPDRARGLSRGARPAAWEELAAVLGPVRGDGGAGLRLLLRPSTSPLVGALLQRVSRRHPRAKVAFWAPLDRGQAEEGARLAFGAPLVPRYDFAAADVVLALDGDFLARGPGRIRHQAAWASRRRPVTPGGTMSRLYVVEPTLSLAGGMADHRLRRRSGDVLAVLAAIVDELGAAGVAVSGALRDAVRGRRRDEDCAFAAAVARDLAAARGRSIVYTDERQPPVVHALCHALNATLGAVGHTVTLHPSPRVTADNEIDLPTLARELAGGTVDTLVALGGNPLYDAPADLALPALWKRVPHTICLAPYVNETAQASAWHLAEAHPLEAWGDARAVDGTISLQQPLLAPLYGGRTVAELLALLAGDLNPDGQTLLRAHHARLDLDRALQKGVLDGTATAAQTPTARDAAIVAALGKLPVAPASDGAIELALYPDPSAGDGTHTNNAWLQELPRPFTKLTWDNALLVSPRTAQRLQLADEVVALVTVGDRRLEAPVLVAPGQADGTVTLTLGYGRRGAERLARGLGVDGYVLSTTQTPFFVPNVEVHAAGARHALARTQEHWSMEGREIALALPLQLYRQRPRFADTLKGRPPSLYHTVPASHGTPQYGGHRDQQWGMAIDLSTCVSCMACVVACQAENNVFVVGKEGVLRSREMHWLRIDTYFRGTPDEPRPVHQPMLCQHCEKAPCEYVCPVNATVHSPDGLNEMVYNRCVGTRFCSNNCPYKVRRFNWLRWEKEVPENGGTYALQRNPEVTVRARGVMEKCTFCVQRIRHAQIDARLGDKPIADGEVRTACQQACPSGAISFGAINDPKAEVVAKKGEARAYNVLNDLGTRPRVSYLARLENPNPSLGPLASDAVPGPGEGENR